MLPFPIPSVPSLPAVTTPVPAVRTHLSVSAPAPTAGVVDWAAAELPDAWPDRLRFRDLAVMWHGVSRLWTQKKRPVSLPADLPGRDRLPGYLLQEFHHLPNGNFSKTITSSYAFGFDRVMLGTLVAARRAMAKRLASAGRVLDVGTGSGPVAAALQQEGVPDVWALEPSPYLLQHAARENPGLRCVQGVVEDTRLPSHHFAGATACFVFHEIPPERADLALRELRRILKPGARLVIVEPSPEQLRLSPWALWRRYGWRGLYFRLLARRVYEPYLEGWHGRQHRSWLGEHGFDLEEDVDRMPWRMLVAKARAT
jgi:ubiquinone/menaquinone biosynthesis C-methylase UbiE